MSFWLRVDNSQGQDQLAPDNHFVASWNGQTLMAMTNAPDSGYQLYTFDVVGVAGNSTLEFRGYNLPDAMRLDDISVTAAGNDNGQTPGSLSINDVTISEGDSGTKVATFTVTRSGGTAAFDVNYATSNGTATVADNDYVATSNTLHFGANENTKTISVTINGDTKVEPDETFNVVLSNATNGATISDGQGVGTITNDDAVVAVAGSVSINDVTISEGNSGTKVATFTVTRSGGTAAFDVNYATSDGTATVADSDYVAASNTLHFGANENTKTISVTINGDTKVEANETFNVVLSNATNGATISDGQGVGTITNDDVTVNATPNLVANGSFETGGFSGWTRSAATDGIYIAPTDFPGEVHTGSYSVGLGGYTRSDGVLSQSIATTAGQHYTVSFWLSVDNNQNAPDNHFVASWNGQTLVAMTNAPDSDYQLYTFDVVGAAGNSPLEFRGYNLPDAMRLDDIAVTAVGNDTGQTPGSVSIDDVTISEGNSGTKVATFTVTRSGGTAAFDVNYATSNGTATVADSDYVATSNTLHFGANEDTKTISVTINGDTKVEANETFNVVLSNATNGATISDGQGVGTITNDEPTFTNNADTVTLPVLGGTFNALGGDDRLSYTGGAVTIDGGAGTDTVDFSSFGSAVWVGLAYNGPEIWTMDRADLSGGTWRAIGDLSNVENLIGTPFSDLLRGDGSANVLTYTGGFDTLDGGAGSDTADFSRFGSAVWADLAYSGTEAWTRDRADVNSGTWREIADLTNIENLVGTGGADKLFGDATANRIEGGAGDDVLTGRGGNDTFVFNPGFGNDNITDFDPSNDVIQFNLALFANYSAAMASTKQVGTDTVIAFDSNDAVTLANVSASSLSSNNFKFS